MISKLQYRMKKYFLIVFLSVISFSINAQIGTLIGEKYSNTIDNAAEFEIYSNDKGFLIPNIADPAVTFDGANPPVAGLMIYNSTTNKFNYFDGTGWIELPYFTTIKDLDDDTYISVEVGTTDNDSIVFANNGSTSASIDNSGFTLNDPNGKYLINGKQALASPNTNVLSGEDAGSAIVAGVNNTALGSNSLALSNSNNNTVIGASAGATGTVGNANVLVGPLAGINAAADSSVFIGAYAGEVAQGSRNIVIGENAGRALTTGSNNVFIGNNTAYNSGLAGETVTGSSNIIIGNGELIDDVNGNIKIGKLIEVDDANIVHFNGDKYNFPATSGLENQTLVLDSDLQTLLWEDAGVRGVDQTVIASAANLYPFDFGIRDDNDDVLTYQRNTFIVPLVPEMSTSINNIMTWIKNADNSTLEVAIYDGITLDRLAIGSAVYSITEVIAGDFVSATLDTEVELVQDQLYYVAVRVEATTSDFAGLPSVVGNVQYIVKKIGGVVTCDPANVATMSVDYSLTNFPSLNPALLPADYGICNDSGAPIPWIRAF